MVPIVKRLKRNGGKRSDNGNEQERDTDISTLSPKVYFVASAPAYLLLQYCTQGCLLVAVCSRKGVKKTTMRENWTITAREHKQNKPTTCAEGPMRPEKQKSPAAALLLPTFKALQILIHASILPLKTRNHAATLSFFVVEAPFSCAGAYQELSLTRSSKTASKTPAKSAPRTRRMGRAMRV